MIKINNKVVLCIICSIVCGTIFSGITSNNVFAEDVNYEVNIATGINITIPSDTVTLSLNPFVTDFGSTDLPVTVKTNNPTGYTLTMSPSDDTTTSLTRTGGTETIPTLDDLSGGYTEQTFTTNKWGYKLSSTNYLPFTTSNEITTTNAPTAASGNTSTVTFAAKGDTTLMSGAYNLEITFTAVANRVPVTWDMAYADAGKTKYNGYYKIQDATSAICTAVDMNEIGEVIDVRDNEVYKVGKLADNKCWMLDNLRLDLTNSTIRNALTASNTNANETSLTSLRSGNRSAGEQYASSGFATWAVGDTANVYNQAKANVDYKDTTTTSYGSGSGKIGVYYNYCAASAGSYCYDVNAGTGNASQDICPSGWRMPTSGSSGEYQALRDKYNTTQDTTNIASLQYNLSTPLSGLFYSGSASYQVTRGYFWSSTRNGSSAMYTLYVGSSNVDPRNGIGRCNGSSVRCLLQ